MTRAYKFLCLKPDAALSAIILANKALAREAVGDQLYLSDPPHLTLFLAGFPSETQLLQALPASVLVSAPVVTIAGWHHYLADPLNGKNTLVMKLPPLVQSALREVQRQVVDALAPHRDEAFTKQRYAARWESLAPELRANITERGFPFLGEGWQPHFTVAAFDPAVWEQVLALPMQLPSGQYSCSALEEYELDGIQPILRGRREFTSYEG
ncbi:MAG: 2'-5' RNA ligase family protein [Gemmataceae bacterium]